MLSQNGITDYILVFITPQVGSSLQKFFHFRFVCTLLLGAYMVMQSKQCNVLHHLLVVGAFTRYEWQY